jgi:hypothetical protein
MADLWEALRAMFHRNHAAKRPDPVKKEYERRLYQLERQARVRSVDAQMPRRQSPRP